MLVGLKNWDDLAGWKKIGNRLAVCHVADVIELIQAHHLKRELVVDEAVRALYVETWDALAAEQ